MFGRRCRGNVLLNPKILPNSFYEHILEWNAAGCGVSLQSCEHEEGDGGWGRFKRQEAYFSCMCLYRQHCLTGTQWCSLLMKQQLQMLNLNDRTHKQGFGLEASAVITAFLLINLHNIPHYGHEISLRKTKLWVISSSQFSKAVISWTHEIKYNLKAV